MFASSLFVFYIAHDALQERMFPYDGFQFGFFMILVKVIVMLVGFTISKNDTNYFFCAFAKSKQQRKVGKRKTVSASVLIRIGWVGLFLALAHGLGNTLLNYSHYPSKVVFKSCKLVPMMAMGACVTAADVFNSKQVVPIESHGIDNSDWSKEIGPFIRPILLSIPTMFDSIVSNLQEQLLQTAKVKTSD